MARVKPLYIVVAAYIVIAIVWSLLNRDVITLYTGYLGNDLYNYLYVSPIAFALLIVLWLGGREAGYTPESFILGIIFIGLSGLALLKAYTTGLIDFFLPLSFILVLYGAYTIFFAGRNVGFTIAASLFMLTMIPIPPSYIFNLTAVLTRLTGSAAIALSKLMGVGLEYTTISGYQVVIVYSPTGPVHFSLAPVCSGIIGLTSVLAVTPLLFLIALKSSIRSRVGKLGLFVLGSTVLSILMFLGNILRLSLVFTLTYYFGKDIGYGLFHYTPEIVLVFPIAYVTVKVMDKLGHGYSIDFRPPKLNYGVTGALLLTFLVAISLIPVLTISSRLEQTVPPAFYVDTHNGPPKLLNRANLSIEPALPVPTAVYMGRQSSWEEMLGPTTRVHFYRIDGEEGVPIYVYIEFSKYPSQIHVWEICLEWQGITNHTSRSIIVTESKLHYSRNLVIVNFTHKGMQGIIVYWRDKVYTEDGVEYFRVSVIASGRGILKNYSLYIGDMIDIAKRIWVLSLLASYSVYGLSIIGLQELNIVTTYYILIAIFYATIIYAGKVFRANKLKNKNYF